MGMENTRQRETKSDSILLIGNSGNYLYLSIVVHNKKVCNNNLLRVNFYFYSNY